MLYGDHSIFDPHFHPRSDPAYCPTMWCPGGFHQHHSLLLSDLFRDPIESATALWGVNPQCLVPEWSHDPVNLARRPCGMNFKFSSFGNFRTRAFLRIGSLDTTIHPLHGSAGSRRDGLFPKHAAARTNCCSRKLSHRNSVASSRTTLASSPLFRPPNDFANSSCEMV